MAGNSIKLDGNSTVPVKLIVKDGSSNPVTSTTPVDTKVRDLLVAAFEAIPSQSGATATVAAIVTALKTIV